MPEQQHKGIVILGCPRSGTTLLRRIMDAHPEISAPGETYLLTSCARFLHSETVVDGMEVGVLNGLGFLGFDSDDVVARLREFAFAFRQEHAEREGKTRWAEKTAIDAFHVPAIERLCGDHASFVCIVRHGLDVALSMQDWTTKSQAFPSEIHDYVRETPRPLEAFCRAWADATTAICDFAEAHPENAILIRYEDLIADPDAVLGSIFDHLGAELTPELVELALSNRDAKGFSDWKSFSKTEIEAGSIGRWNELSAATLAGLAPAVNSVLERLGYPSLDATTETADETARRRYNMGLLLQSMHSDKTPDDS